MKITKFNFFSCLGGKGKHIFYFFFHLSCVFMEIMNFVYFIRFVVSFVTLLISKNVIHVSGVESECCCQIDLAKVQLNVVYVDFPLFTHPLDGRNCCQLVVGPMI